MRHSIIIAALILSFMSSPVAAAAQDHHREQFLNSLKDQNDKAVGEAVYNHFCATCHAQQPSIPLGAPRVGIKKDWQKRQNKRNIKQMLKRIDAGFDAMPARGGCFECTDQQLLAAINYLLPKNQPKRK